MNIRPVSDLRNHYSEVEEQVNSQGPVFLTKNGYGSMVVMNINQFDYLNGDIEHALDLADAQAAATNVRFSHDEVFGSIRKAMNFE